MSNSEGNAGSARPRQVTTAAWFVIGGSVLLLLFAFDRTANIGSLSMREEIEEVLGSPSGEGLGLSVDQAFEVMRIGLAIAAVCAAVAAVLGVAVLSRNRTARIGLAVVAVPLLITSPLTGGFFGALVAAATVMLWTRPARDWFAGRPVVDTPRRGLFGPVAAERDSTERTNPMSGPAPSVSPVAAQSPPGPAWPPPVPASVRAPQQVVTASLLTIGTCVLVAMVYVGALAIFVLNPESWYERIEESSFIDVQVSRELMQAAIWLTTIGFILWCLVAIGLALWFWRTGADWARILVLVSAVGAGVLSMLAFPVGLPVLAVCAVTIWLLASAPSRAWAGQRTH